MATIRKARDEDAPAIHAVQMRSIREVCAKDHTAAEIAAWGNQPYNEMIRLNAIRKQVVYVVEISGQIEGYGHLGVYEKSGRKMAHIYGIYLSQAALGRKLGLELANSLISEARRTGVEKIRAEATVTAHEFMKKLGFQEERAQGSIAVGPVTIKCFPMFLSLKGKP